MASRFNIYSSVADIELIVDICNRRLNVETAGHNVQSLITRVTEAALCKIAGVAACTFIIGSYFLTWSAVA